MRIRVAACGVCRTDLHIVEGELPWPGHAVVPGHEIVGRIDALGPGVSGLVPGQRVGVPWLGWACGRCEHCVAGRENLCPQAEFMGWQREGGYAEQVLAFTWPGDTAAQALALGLGAAWAGDAGQTPPAALDAALIFAPVGALVPAVLRAVRPGGTVVCAGIHMSDIPSFPCAWLWAERRIVSVANLTRQDGEQFMQVAALMPLQVRPRPSALDQANQALDELRAGRFAGAAVLPPRGLT